MGQEELEEQLLQEGLQLRAEGLLPPWQGLLVRSLLLALLLWQQRLQQKDCTLLWLRWQRRWRTSMGLSQPLRPSWRSKAFEHALTKAESSRRC